MSLLLLVGANGPFYPNFAPPAASRMHACMHAFFFFFACRLHVIISRHEMQNIWNFRFQRDLYCTPNLFKYFKLGQNAPSISRV